MGSAPLGEDEEESRSLAYQRAVGTLALMAGQTITSSFQEWVKERKVWGKFVEEAEAINSIKVIAQQGRKTCPDE